METLKGRIFRRERKSSVVYAAGRWTPQMVDSITPPRESTRFRVYYTTAMTNSNMAGSEWLAYPAHTPRQWIEATFPDFKRILSIVRDKA